MGAFSIWTGAVVNGVGIVIGSIIGMLIGKRFPERLQRTVTTALGFCVLYIGITGALEGRHALVVILSLILGSVVGELCDLDRQINRLGSWLERTLSRGDHPVPLAEGFVNACLLFCVGAMTIVGSLNSGLNHDHSTLYAKSCLDTVSAVVMASTLGAGVTLSAVAVVALQGGIAVLAHSIEPLLAEAVIAEMTCVGSLLIIGLSLNLLGISKFKIMNFVPAILLPIALCPLYDGVVGWLLRVL